MMGPQIKMIFDMVKAVAKSHGITVEEAYDIVLTWIAVQVQAEEQLSTDGIKQDAYDIITELFDISVLQEEKRDWLGAAAVVLGIWPGFPLAEEYQLKAEAATSNITFGDGVPKALLVENVWTGRDILALHNIAGERAIYCGTEQDLRLYRTAVLNMHIHKIPAQILYVDNMTDTSLGSENWRCSNLWNPVKMSKLKQVEA